MAKISKGFSDLLKLERQKSQKSAKSTSKMTILAKNQNDEAYVEYNFEEQEQRIGRIVGFDDDGEVLSVNTPTNKNFTVTITAWIAPGSRIGQGGPAEF